MKSYYIISLAAYIASFLMLFHLYEKLNIEKLISGKTRIRISVFLTAIAFYIIGSLITDNLNTAEVCRSLIKSFFVYGPATALIVFSLPVRRR